MGTQLFHQIRVVLVARHDVEGWSGFSYRKSGGHKLPFVAIAAVVRVFTKADDAGAPHTRSGSGGVFKGFQEFFSVSLEGWVYALDVRSDAARVFGSFDFYFLSYFLGHTLLVYRKVIHLYIFL